MLHALRHKRIELSDLPKSRDEARLLHAMGWETANIHLGTKGAAKTIRKHLQKLDGATWLKEAARTMTHELEADWHAWRDAFKGEHGREPVAHAAS